MKRRINRDLKMTTLGTAGIRRIEAGKTQHDLRERLVKANYTTMELTLIQ